MKKRIIIGVIATILLSGIIFAVLWFKQGTTDDSTVEIKAAAGEEIVYATIERITGNDIEVVIMDEAVAEQIITMSKAANEMAGTVETQKASYRIPVGTDVITKLGATTTFSHLEEGDTIAILFEEETEAILKIWMVM